MAYACLYEDPADLLVWMLKFQHRMAAARVMADLMLARAQPLKFTCDSALVPVPLHWWRHWQRGFNQAELIARHLARQTGLPMLNWRVRRVRATVSQVGMDRQTRQRNLARAFAARHQTRHWPAHLILVDDVMTTGATLNSLAQTLLDAGTRRTDAWVFARTMAQVK